jgi:hypothetical protein
VESEGIGKESNLKTNKLELIKKEVSMLSITENALVFLRNFFSRGLVLLGVLHLVLIWAID